MLLLNRLKLPVGVAVLTLAGVGLTSLSPTPQVSAAPVPKGLKQPVGGIGVSNTKELPTEITYFLYLLTPDGTTTHQFELSEEVEKKWGWDWREGPCTVHVSPYGFPVAVLVPQRREEEEEKKEDIGPPPYQLRLIRSADDLKREAVKMEGRLTGELVWSRSGKQFYVGTRKDDTPKNCYLAIDPATGQATKSVVPEGHMLVAELADGTLVTNGTWEKLAPRQGQQVPLLFLYKVSADGKVVTELTPCPYDRHLFDFDLSPDGNTVLTWRYDKAVGSAVLYTFDLTTGKTTDVKSEILNGAKINVRQAKWSPDGKKVGFIFSPCKDAPWETPDHILHVCDLDGGNGSDLCIWKKKGGAFGESRYVHFEWN